LHRVTNGDAEIARFAMPVSEVADIRLMGLGVDYYVVGRAAALAQRMPLAGNQFHHALEVMLKARLSQKHSLLKLSREFGHYLPRLWEAFKADFPGRDLREFDETVATLDRFEGIRYPDKIITEGMIAHVEWDKPGGRPSTGRSEPKYVVVVNDIDRLVAKIFELSSRNPAFWTRRLNDYARDALTRANPVADLLLERRVGT
jgi:hypothetical protein